MQSVTCPNIPDTMQTIFPTSNSKSVAIEEKPQNAPNNQQNVFEDNDNDSNDTSPKAFLRYKSLEHYTKMMKYLIDWIIEDEIATKQSQTEYGVFVKFMEDWIDDELRFLAYFKLSICQEFDSTFLIGKRLRIISHPPRTLSIEGEVIRTNGDTIYLAPKNKKEIDGSELLDGCYDVVHPANLITAGRMNDALRSLHDDSISKEILQIILGKIKTADSLPIKSSDEIENIEFTAPNLKPPNESQKKAIKRALESEFCLIQGLPGTGKTLTAALVAYQIVKRSTNTEKVLVCAPSNVVADQLAKAISQTGLNVLRVLSKAKEMIAIANGSEISELCLHYKQNREFWNKFNRKPDRNNDQDLKNIEEIEEDIINKADLICVTCSTAGDKRLKDFKFKHVLIDEATQCIETEALIPISKGAGHVILVGDHKQLGPVLKSQEAKYAGFDMSLFERLVKIGMKPVMLTLQFRMHPELTKFPSKTFYDGALVSGVTLRNRPVLENFFWPDRKFPMFFLHVPDGREEKLPATNSYFNKDEAHRVVDVIAKLMKAGVQANKIGVITFYFAQKQHIKYKVGLQAKLNQIWRDVDVNTVDGYQGREKDYIVISCVRSNETNTVGFIGDERRMNVAITRAKFGMVICGNATVLANDPLWGRLLMDYDQKRLVVKGNLLNLVRINPFNHKKK